MIILLLSFLGLNFASLQQEPGYTRIVGRASQYWPGDGHCGSELANGKTFKVTDAHFAHRTLPLGTSGILCSIRTGLCVRTSAQDRGPFGSRLSCLEAKRDPSKLQGRTLVGKPPRLVRWGKRRDGTYRVCYWWQAQIRLKPGWKRRGEFDLTRPVAKAIGHKAFGRVVFFYKKKPREEI